MNVFAPIFALIQLVRIGRIEKPPNPDTKAAQASPSPQDCEENLPPPPQQDDSPPGYKVRWHH